MVTGVDPDGPAAEQGFQTGTVILDVGGKAVAHERIENRYFDGALTPRNGSLIPTDVPGHGMTFKVADADRPPSGMTDVRPTAAPTRPTHAESRSSPGATAGVGRATAIVFARAGFDVALLARGDAVRDATAPAEVEASPRHGACRRGGRG